MLHWLLYLLAIPLNLLGASALGAAVFARTAKVKHALATASLLAAVAVSVLAAWGVIRTRSDTVDAVAGADASSKATMRAIGDETVDGIVHAAVTACALAGAAGVVGLLAARRTRDA